MFDVTNLQIWSSASSMAKHKRVRRSPTSCMRTNPSHKRCCSNGKTYSLVNFPDLEFVKPKFLCSKSLLAGLGWAVWCSVSGVLVLWSVRATWMKVESRVFCLQDVSFRRQPNSTGFLIQLPLREKHNLKRMEEKTNPRTQHSTPQFLLMAIKSLLYNQLIGK